MTGFCNECGNVLPNHRATCSRGQREAARVIAREKFDVEPGRTITLGGRAIFRLAPVITESGAYAIAPALLDKAAHVVADALQEVARLGLHLNLEGE